MKTYYEDLEVPETATTEEIRKAYHRLSLETHPDKNLENIAAAEEFKIIGKAYEVLGNPESKTAYDEELVSSRKPRTRSSTTAYAEEDREAALSRLARYKREDELRHLELTEIVKKISIPEQLRRMKAAATKRKQQAVRRSKQRAEERAAWLFVKFGIRPFKILIPRLSA
jgi:curved DNA-binding protein CbpA